MDIKENKTVKSHFTCSLSSLLGFWVVLEPFMGFLNFLPLTALRKRKGWKLQRLQNTHDSTRSRLSRENREALGFCFGRAKLEHYFLSFYHSRSEIETSRTTLEREKHQPFAILNAFLRKEYHTSVTRPVRINGQGQ